MSNAEPFTIEQFYNFLKQGKLMAGKCIKCGKVHLPPRPLCSNCFSTEFTWVEISGEGKLLTYTVINIAPEQFKELAPYAVGIVEMTGGLKIPGMLQNIKPDQLKIGMALKLDFGTCNQPQCWPHWPRYCFKPM